MTRLALPTPLGELWALWAPGPLNAYVLAVGGLLLASYWISRRA